ncbi:PREDICTED: UDP-glycosyltransferase 74F2-like [Tarenaya hassleriana]|uniref:UDP-glycosyltransferase 74F2-like n=1 Tax=Tarenaya hassleriana TaxID=28532 RepID=UPI00053C623F|nr:PREDICTED: UDP-glycosyltransferase 74F2-like [Tarenaya hassleriana]
MERGERGHVLAVPYPSQGHITPIHQFCKRLVSKGMKTSLALTNFIHSSIKSDPSPFVPLETISDGYDSGGFMAAENIHDYLHRLRSVGTETLAQLIRKHQSSDNPITCLVYDPFLPWAFEVGREFGLTVAPFFTQSCAVNYVYYLAHQGKLRLPIDGLSFLEQQDIPSFISVPGSYPAYFEMVLHQFSNFHKADFVLFNVFQKLEVEETELMSKVCPVMTVGPTVPSMYLDRRIETDNNYDLMLFDMKDSEFCTEWLNEKPQGSVVYVAFGSMADLSRAQMEELAWSLSNFSFLWVVRGSEEAKLPSGFLQTVDRDKSLVVKWSPQLEVLSNRAIGCFVTHCGWNSTMEALSLGVPLVAMPQWTDQPTNAKYIEDVWKVGVRVKEDEESGIVRREEIEFCIRQVMEGEKSREVKENAKKWRDLAMEAVGEGGTSDVNIQTLVSMVKSLKQKPSLQAS